MVLVLSFPAQTAAALAGRVLAEVAQAPDDDLVRDCMGELANVIAGQAKTLLAETPYQLLLATPSILSGAGLEVGLAAGRRGPGRGLRQRRGRFRAPALPEPAPVARSAGRKGWGTSALTRGTNRRPPLTSP